jgi:hypothetical protein
VPASSPSSERRNVATAALAAPYNADPGEAPLYPGSDEKAASKPRWVFRK